MSKALANRDVRKYSIGVMHTERAVIHFYISRVCQRIWFSHTDFSCLRSTEDRYLTTVIAATRQQKCTRRNICRNIRRIIINRDTYKKCGTT